MSTFTGRTKSSTVTARPRYKAGSGWDYNDPNLTYDGTTDPVSGLNITYDGVGTLPVFTGRTKSSTVTATPRTKS